MLELVLTRCTSECRRANAFHYSVSGFLKTYLVRLCIYSDWPYFYGLCLCHDLSQSEDLTKRVPHDRTDIAIMLYRMQLTVL